MRDAIRLGRKHSLGNSLSRIRRFRSAIHVTTALENISRLFWSIASVLHPSPLCLAASGPLCMNGVIIQRNKGNVVATTALCIRFCGRAGLVWVSVTAEGNERTDGFVRALRFYLFG